MPLSVPTLPCRCPRTHQRAFPVLELPNKADAFARQRADQPLLVAIVADRSPDSIDACSESGFRHNAPAPDCLKNIVLADDAMAVCDEVFQ
jgi:hypothetical protein